jgi:hypothetical protein
MSMKSLIAHAIFCGLAAALALFAAGEPAKTATAEGAVTLLDLELADVDRVYYTWADGSLTVTGEGAGDAREWTADLEHAPPGSSADPTPARERFVFPAGRTVRRALEALAPFQAQRSLGAIEGEKLEELGLASPERSLEVVVKGKSYAFDVGAATPGKRSRYVRRKGERGVHLVPNQAVGGLEGNPARLQESKVLSAEAKDVLGFAAQRKGNAAEVVHAARDDAKEHFWALAASPGERSEEASSMYQALRGLRITRYVDEKDAEGAEVEAAWSVKLEGRALEIAVLHRAEPEAWYVRAGRWTATVSDKRAKRAIEDLDALLSP